MARKKVKGVVESELILDIYSGYGVPNSKKYSELLLCMKVDEFYWEITTLTIIWIEVDILLLMLTAMNREFIIWQNFELSSKRERDRRSKIMVIFPIKDWRGASLPVCFTLWIVEFTKFKDICQDSEIIMILFVSDRLKIIFETEKFVGVKS